MSKQSEADRRAAQSQHARKKKQTTREVRRESQRAGDVVIFNARETFKLDYKFSVPPGVLRDDNPVQVSGTLVTDSESDILRGIFVKLAELCGYGRPEFGKAVTGMFAEIINPLSMSLRALIAVQIAQGTGLDIHVQEMTSCVDCGAEREIVDIMIPLDSTDDSESEFVRQEDQTAHRPECPSQARVDMDKVAEMAKAHEEAVAVGEAEADDWLKDKPMLPPSKEIEWKTGPALVILHPQKYQPLMTAPSAEAQETMGEIPEGDDDKILTFPGEPVDTAEYADPPSAGLV